MANFIWELEKRLKHAREIIASSLDRDAASKKN